jgi:hypothetical protein
MFVQNRPAWDPSVQLLFNCYFALNTTQKLITVTKAFRSALPVALISRVKSAPFSNSLLHAMGIHQIISAGYVLHRTADREKIFLHSLHCRKPT